MAHGLATLSKLFTDRLFRVPDYQRGYSWQERHVADFWSDLNALEEGKSHYAGVITLEEVLPDTWKRWTSDAWLMRSKGYSPFFVVDGQQRLTTSLILIQCLIDSIKPGIEKLNFSSAREIQKRYIYESLESGVSKSLIFDYEENNPSYEYLRQVVFSDTPKRGGLSRSAYTTNLDKAKDFLSAKIKPLSLEARGDLFRRLTHSVLFNVYEVDSEVDTCIAFETMNNRGKPLSHLELLKNRLIYLTTCIDSFSTSEVSGLRDQINKCWRNLYHHLGRNPEKLLDDDRFLLTHSQLYFANQLFPDDEDDVRIYIRLGLNGSSSSLERLLEEIFTKANVVKKDSSATQQKQPHQFSVDARSLNNYVTDLSNSVQIWFELLNPALSELSDPEKLWLDRLNRLSGLGFSTFALAFYRKEQSTTNRVAFLEALEKALFRFQINYYGSLTGIEGAYFKDVLRLVRDKISPDRLIRQLLTMLGDNDQKALLWNSFSELGGRKRGFYEWAGIRYFLYEYEQWLQSKSKQERSKIKWTDLVDPPGDHITVEHIYPQNARDESWLSTFESFTPTQKLKLRNSLGNLLPLSKPKNSSLQNKSFHEKCNGVSGSLVAFKYGSLSEIEVSQAQKWDAEAILSRGIKLLTFAEERWGLDLGDTTRKAKLLGLDFVIKMKAV